MARRSSLINIAAATCLLTTCPNAFLINTIRSSRSSYSRAMMMKASQNAVNRRSFMNSGAATALIISALPFLQRPSITQAANEVPAAYNGFIYPNISEPNFTKTCFLEFESNGKNLGRVEISLYGDITPKTAQNFAALCQGNGGLSYKGSNVYRVLKDFSIQAGDIGSKKRGVTGKSSFDNGEAFAKENVRIRHSLEGLVSMVNDREGKVDSRFFINMGEKDASWADDRYVCFGRVTKGLEVLKEMEKAEVKPPSNVPVKPIVITNAGVFN